MLDREIVHELGGLAKQYPVVTIIGPRQAGKNHISQAFVQSVQLRESGAAGYSKSGG